MRNFKILAPLASVTLLVSAGCRTPSNYWVDRDNSLFEMFGRSKPDASSPLFLLTPEARKSIPKEKLELFVRAQMDLDLITSGQMPIFCSPGMAFDDGGTMVYSGFDYIITKWSQLRTINGIRCARVGISIKFNANGINENRPFDDVSHTWIEFLK